MKIDWKSLCKTPGYMSLKEAMTEDIRKNWRSKKESYFKFTWVIARAKHYAHCLNKPIEDVLNAWETGRNYWWLNYYQDCNQPKLNKSLTVKPQKSTTYYRKCKHYTTEERKKFNLREIMRLQKLASKRKGKKVRWGIKHKADMKKYRGHKNL